MTTDRSPAATLRGQQGARGATSGVGRWGKCGSVIIAGPAVQRRGARRSRRGNKALGRPGTAPLCREARG
ncbi:hypothetical protein SKAU_G00199650 [Synaphobranchus kaupii]|uniref:Uncharacterized protein n=1 Tax=Synaphobranchus kaupii TaxID=118154 RepID=A0A9Q1FFA7_SYNKA|nr:hypothetical protein SKAU_G00199650 [Synaphobranchus kaupii]